MATKVVMEALSPTMEEGTLVKWVKAEGDEVRSGDTLAEVETDKAIMELVARSDGILRAIVAGEGTTLEVGSLVGVIGGADEDISVILGNGAGGTGGPAGTSEAAAPEVQPTPADAAAASPVSPPPSTAGGRIKASPLARRLAADRGVDLAMVTGSGPSGRIIKRDVDHAPASPPLAGLAAGPEFEDVPLTQIRRTIARRLTESIGPVPHFFLTTEADMERAAAARAELNAIGDVKISVNDIVIKVVAQALTRHRHCNAWWQDDHIRYFAAAHISVAVAVEDGLITPVIRHAESKSIRTIATEVRELAARAREKRLAPEEYSGGTFSISNLGMYGITQFTGVINPPEAGLLAVGAMAEVPAVVDGAVEVRKRMKLTMSCDHRVIDGATGAEFLQTVKRMLENPLAIVW